MDIDQIERDLPWGFHDADLRSYCVNLADGTASFDLEVPLDKRQTVRRHGRLDVHGVQFVAVSPPTKTDFVDDLWIDSFPGQWDGDPIALPPIAPDAWLHTLWRKESATYIHIAARDATFTWTGEPFSTASRHPVYFPGEEAPDFCVDDRDE
jgi:hypothetical protein